MAKIYKLSIFLSFAGLWITSIFSGDFEVVLGFVLIFSFGILHGSNDILLMDSISKQHNKYRFTRVLITYIVIVLIAAFIFYVLPILALLLFVIFSAFHFGEQHWEYRALPLLLQWKNCFYFIYGLLVLQILFVLNPTDTIEIVYSISGYTLHTTTLIYGFATTLIAFVAFIMYLVYQSPRFKSIVIIELGYLLIFAVLFQVSTLIWGFTIYFIFWHSLPSLYEQIKFIYNDVNKKNTLTYLKKAFPYWFVSLIGITIVYILFKDDTLFYALFFSFLAAITFPHTIIINKMFTNKKSQSN